MKKSAAKSEPKIRDHHFHLPGFSLTSVYTPGFPPQLALLDRLLEYQRIRYKGGRKGEYHKLSYNDYTPY